jgi:hypothetical protein
MPIAVITDAEAMGEYRSISEFDMFEVEYWSLEQAKLGKSNEKSLARQVAVITGGGSGIGAATARAMAKEGAEVAVLDRDLEAAKAVAKKIGGKALAVECDVTTPQSVRAPSMRWCLLWRWWISWCPMPARPGRAPSARWMTRPCARASS